MDSAGGTAQNGGLPHSEIPGSKGARASPGLFAACHVLHRLSTPRHSPDALGSLSPHQHQDHGIQTTDVGWSHDHSVGTELNLAYPCCKRAPTPRASRHEATDTHPRVTFKTLFTMTKIPFRPATEAGHNEQRSLPAGAAPASGSFRTGSRYGGPGLT